MVRYSNTAPRFQLYSLINPFEQRVFERFSLTGARTRTRALAYSRGRARYARVLACA